MRKIFYAAIAAITLALVAPFGASAAPVSQPGAVKALADDFGATTQVQHRRSWSHRRWGSGWHCRPGSGWCAPRRYRYVYPRYRYRYYYAPRYRYYRVYPRYRYYRYYR